MAALSLRSSQDPVRVARHLAGSQVISSVQQQGAVDGRRAWRCRDGKAAG